MYLILGSGSDPCCSQISSILERRGENVRTIASLFSEPHSLVWKFAGAGSSAKSAGRIGFPGEWECRSDEIQGVFVRDSAHSASGEWSEQDRHYMASETQAALLGWLWSLDCPVVNRPSPWLFYRPRPALLDWMPLLRRAGLHTPATVIGNDPRRLADWRERHSEGALLAPLIAQAHFALQTGAEWDGVLRLARHAPVLLEQAHGPTNICFVIGDRIVWNGPAIADGALIENRLRDFVQLAGLDSVQIALARQSRTAEYAVVSVESRVDFSRFTNQQQQTIAESIANLMMASHPQPSMEQDQPACLAGGAR